METTATSVVMDELITITVLYPGKLQSSLLRACSCECACDESCGSDCYDCASDCFMCD